MIADRLTEAIRKVLKTLGIESADVHLEHPAELSHGDYSTNVALAYAKELKQKPRDMAERIVTELKSDFGTSLKSDLERTEVAGAGFINFHLSKAFFAETVKNVGEDFGKNKSWGGKKVMVEYTDPNPFKEFHIGHLMSNAIGESVARIFEYHGAKVLRACWQGDVGLHVAKAIFGAKELRPKTAAEWGEAYILGSFHYGVIDGKAKKEIELINKAVYDRTNDEINNLYDNGRKVSLEHFEEIYKVLGTKFNYYFFEGKEGREGQPIVEEGLKKGVFEKSDGAIVYKGEKKGLHTRVFITSQGLPTYEAKELGLNKAKFEKEPDLDESVIVTANEQSDYFKVVLAAMAEVLPEIAKRIKHLAHGMLRFASGKMSSRTGNVITGESLIHQVKEMVFEKIKGREMSEKEKETLAETVAVGAIKYSILRQALGGDIIFDFEKSIAFEGDSGPYLQYSYVRAKSVLAKAEQAGISKGAPFAAKGAPLLLERLLYRFPEIVERAGKEYEPHYITTFLIELAGAFNSWYAKEQIVASEDAASPYKVALTGAFATTMRNGLWLLGIKVPEKM